MNGRKEFMQDLLYMQMLQPDEGYEIDFAVGTTFSLSMDGLISVPLAFGNMGDAKQVNNRNAMYLLEGIRRTKNKFVLFCNKGFIHVPAKSQMLYSLLEDAVVEMSNLKYPLANFHPKMWVIRQTPIGGAGNSMIKIIVMSRNLTFSNDLDVAVSIKGFISDKKTNSSDKTNRKRPLADMLIYLSKYVNIEKSALIVGLSEDVLKVEHFDFEAPFSQNVYEIHPYLWGDNGNSVDCNTKELKDLLVGKRILIISPFIDSEPNKDGGVLRDIISHADERYLVTRENNISRTVYNMFNGEVYYVNGYLTDDNVTPTDLHSKAYLVERDNNTLYLYFGSANATTNAFQRNCELTFGMKLNSNVTFESIKKELLNENIYVKAPGPLVNEKEEGERRQQEGYLEHIMRWAMSLLSQANISKHKKDGIVAFDVKLKTDIQRGREIIRQYNVGEQDIKRCRIQIRPLQHECDWKSLLTDKLQWSLRLGELSEFYVVEVSVLNNEGIKKQGICKVDSEDLSKLVKERDGEIYSSVLSEDNIMQYINMMLSDFPEYTFEEWNKKESERTAKDNIHGHINELTIYEQLLKASVDNPDRLSGLKDLLNKTGEKKYNDDLVKLLNAFGIILKHKK